jgi:hypothetical protein
VATATARRITPEADITETLARLRLARTVRDVGEARIAEMRLNWLLDKHLIASGR